MFEIVDIAPDGTLILPSKIRAKFKDVGRTLVIEGEDAIILKKIEPSHFVPPVDEETLNRLAPLTEREIEEEIHTYRLER